MSYKLYQIIDVCTENCIFWKRYMDTKNNVKNIYHMNVTSSAKLSNVSQLLQITAIQ